jgi:zinc and cadmium transporter
LHEIPSELADFITLMHSGFKFWKALIYNLLSGFTAILGAVVGWYFVQAIDGILPFMLAFNAGMFIYISCSDLIPALHEDFKRDKRWLQTLTFLLGVAVMFTLINALEPEGEKALPAEPDSTSGVKVIIPEAPASTSHLEAVN